MNGSHEQSRFGDPFAIREHLRVRWHECCSIERLPPLQPGGPAMWSKLYSGYLDAFNKRETELLVCVTNDNVPHVVHYRKIEREVTPLTNPSNTQPAIAVITPDAGLDLDQWMSIKPMYPDSRVALDHPFQHPQTFLALARQILRALQVFHEKHYVHLDLHPKNICARYAPYPFDRDRPVTLLLSEIRLIDLGYTINRRLELGLLLPLNPNAGPRREVKRGKLVRVKEPSAYMAPSLRAALQLNPTLPPNQTGTHADYEEARRRARIGALEELDWRADLYSVGFLLSDIRDEALVHADESDWRLELIESLPERLMQYDLEGVVNKSKPAPPMPHAELIEELGEAIDDKSVTRLLMFDVGPFTSSKFDWPVAETPVINPTPGRFNPILIPTAIAALLLFLLSFALWYYDDLRKVAGVIQARAERIVTSLRLGPPETTPTRDDCANCPPMAALGNGLLLATRQATYAEFDACAAAGQCAARPMRAAGGLANEPARNVSAYDGEQLANWLSKLTARKWRLATLEALEAARADREPARWGNIGAVAGEITGDCALDSPRSADGSCVFRVALAGPAFEDGAGESPRHWLLATGRSQAYGVRLMEDPRR